MSIWNVPVPPKKKLAGPEGLGAYVAELIVAGRPDEALRVWNAPIKGGRYNGMPGGEMLIKVATRDMPTPGARAGSANWGVNACVAWAMMVCHDLIPRQGTPLALLSLYAQWCMGEKIASASPRGLWSSESLSDVYGWILHMLSVAVQSARPLDGRTSEFRHQVSRLLEAHLWLLSRLVVSGGGTGKVVEGQPDINVRHDPVVWAPGERSPPGRHSGAWLTSWYRWIEGMADPMRGPTSNKAWANWPARMTRSTPPVLARHTFPPSNVALDVTIEVARRGEDYSARILRTKNGNTAPTAAVSFVDGKLHVLDVGQRDRRVGQVQTVYEGAGVIAGVSGDLTGRIPAPIRSVSDVWHLGPQGWGRIVP